MKYEISDFHRLLANKLPEHPSSLLLDSAKSMVIWGLCLEKEENKKQTFYHELKLK